MDISMLLLDKDYAPEEHVLYKEFYYLPNTNHYLINKNTLEVLSIARSEPRLIEFTATRGKYRYIAVFKKDGSPVTFNLQLIYLMMFRRNEINISDIAEYQARYPDDSDDYRYCPPITLRWVRPHNREVDSVSNRQKLYSTIGKSIDISLYDKNYSPIEHPDYKGYYIIPGYSNYIINPETLSMISLRFLNSPKELKWSKDPYGYHNITITGDNGIRATFSRHRLIATMFIRNSEAILNNSSYTVDHLNNIKGDDRITNLEWVSYKTNNVRKFSRDNFTVKSHPVEIRNIHTKLVTKYESLVSCAQALNINSDVVSYYITKGPTVIYNSTYQFRDAVYSDEEWFTPDDIENYILRNNSVNQIKIRNVVTGVVTTYDSNREAARCMGIGESTLSRWLDNINQPTYLLTDRTFVQVKYGWDTNDWRPVANVLDDYQQNNDNVRLVVTIDCTTNEYTVYLSAKECCDNRNINPTALNYRLQQNSSKCWDDGYQYHYYHSDIPVDVSHLYMPV